MKSYAKFIKEDLLQEKLIVINNGQKYGQIVFLIGGSGSGKGFAIDNFLNKHNFKVRDVDAWKTSFLKLEKQISDIQKLPACKLDSSGKPIRTGKCNPYGVLRNVDLRNPGDVLKIHEFITDLQIKEKTLELMLNSSNPEHLPNIIFDITGKRSAIKDYINYLMKFGYKPENIHLIWVLANYYEAVKRNSSRERIVPDDVLLKTHENTAKVMNDILNGYDIENLNGSYYIILNNFNSIEFWDKSRTIKNFKYMKIKDSGVSMSLTSNQIGKINSWIISNIPKTLNTADIFDQATKIQDNQ